MISWIAASIVLVGNFALIKYKSWWCFILLLIGNLIYFGYWMYQREWATAILAAVFVAQYFIGIVTWKQK